MDPILFRSIERIVIAVGGIIFAYLGYRLYRHGITEGASKIKIESRWWKLLLSGTGPGLIFMLFGTIILVAGLYLGGIEVAERTRVRGTTDRQIEKLQKEIETIRITVMKSEKLPISQKQFKELEARVSKLEKR